MPKNDPALIRLSDIALALGFLSRLPVSAAGARGAAATWAFPLIGLILGAVVAALAWLLTSFGLSAGLIAGLVLFASIMISGAMHEDGLADSADGLWGGWDKARRLEIMKDSQIGTYGVVALILSLLLRWSAISALVYTDHFYLSLILAAALSRLPMVGMMSAMGNARGDGLSAGFGRVGKDTVGVAFAICLVASIFMGLAGIVALLGVALSGVIVGMIAHRKIGGQTGDILGASQQVAEITALVILATV
jgi:adenosylcobinamide-GDP ribazoletransferase